MTSKYCSQNDNSVQNLERCKRKVENQKKLVLKQVHVLRVRRVGTDCWLDMTSACSIVGLGSEDEANACVHLNFFFCQEDCSEVTREDMEHLWIARLWVRLRSKMWTHKTPAEPSCMSDTWISLSECGQPCNVNTYLWLITWWQIVVRLRCILLGVLVLCWFGTISLQLLNQPLKNKTHLLNFPVHNLLLWWSTLKY